MTDHPSRPAIPSEPRQHGVPPRVRARITRYLLALLAFVLIAPLVPYAAAYLGAGNVPNPGAGLWNEVRQRAGPADANTQARGVESAVLINQVGERWRQFRSEMLVPVGAWLLLGTLGFLALFWILRGRIPLEGGRSGQLVPRFSVNQRVVHWFAAILFVFLAVTGLVLLYGRFVLIPILGPEGFSATAAACKEGHNLFGPIFPFAVLAMIVLFLRGNGFNQIDLKWFFRAGGLLKGHPASSGYYNGGQKSWFWMVVLFGIAISISGLILDFGVFGQGREVMALAHVVHGGVAVVFIAASLGHIYIGTVGMEGAFESMSHGYVDANWAREHHDLWLAEMEAAGMVGVEPNALEEVKRHDNIDFKGFGSPGTKAVQG
ncbi:MAG: formate dehydrogenase subunit gamma [Gemmatimonadetes bacterium]|nr:formate dehydrogenase subunit gamma [Gemmatimonadota bacterium]